MVIVGNVAASLAAVSADDDHGDYRSGMHEEYRNERQNTPGHEQWKANRSSVKTGLLSENFAGVLPLSSPQSASEEGVASLQSPHMKKLEKDLMAEVQNGLNLQDTLMDSHDHWLVDSVLFKGFITFLVLLNAILMGVEADHPEWEEGWFIVDHSFAAAFIIEMFLKLAVLKQDYFRDGWNLLDFSLAVMGFMDTWFVTLIGGNNIGLSNFSILRMLRLVRLIRLARLFRQFGRLVIVMRSIIDAIETTFWVASLLTICIYVCAILCVDFIGKAPEGTYPGYSKDMDVIDEQEVMQNFNPYLAFGSMSSAMASLFNIAILSEWTEIVRPVLIKQPPMALFFIVFCVFVCFGVMNVIIGMIVDSVIQNARALDRELEEAHRNEKVSVLQDLKATIFQLDSSGDANIDSEELERLLSGEDDRLSSLLTKYDEFVQALYRLINGTEFQHMCQIQIAITKVLRKVNCLDTRVETICRSLGLDPPAVPLSGSSESSKAETCQQPVPDSECGSWRAELAACLETVCHKVTASVQGKLKEELAQSLRSIESVFKATCKSNNAAEQSVVTGRWEVLEEANADMHPPAPRHGSLTGGAGDITGGGGWSSLNAPSDDPAPMMVEDLDVSPPASPSKSKNPQVQAFDIHGGDNKIHLEAQQLAHPEASLDHKARSRAQPHGQGDPGSHQA